MAEGYVVCWEVELETEGEEAPPVTERQPAKGRFRRRPSAALTVTAPATPALGRPPNGPV